MTCPICTADAPHVGHGFHHCGSCGTMLLGTSVTVPALVSACRRMVEASKSAAALRLHLRTIAELVNLPTERTPS